MAATPTSITQEAMNAPSEIGSVKITSQEHTPTGRPMAARVQHIGFLGTYSDAGAKVDAMALLGEQSIRYDATLRLLVPD